MDVSASLNSVHGRLTVPKDFFESGFTLDDTADPPPKRPKVSLSNMELEATPARILNEKCPGIEYSFIETQVGSLPFFTTNVKLNEHPFEGCGKSKKSAKNDVAQKILSFVDGNPDASWNDFKKTNSMPINSTSQEDVIIDKEINPDSSKIIEIAKVSRNNPITMLAHLSTAIRFSEFRDVQTDPINPLFSITVTVNNRTFEGTASSKRLAKLAAAHLALNKVCGVTLPNNKLKSMSTTQKAQTDQTKQQLTNERHQSQPQSQPSRNNNFSGRKTDRRGNRNHRNYDSSMNYHAHDTYELPATQSFESRRFSNSCRLWVGSLPKAATVEGIKELFEPYGAYEDFYYDEAKRFAFITLDYKNNAETAKNELNNKRYLDSSIIVRFSAPGCSIKVKNLSPWVTNELLDFAFSKFGELEKAMIITDERGKTTGEGIVEYCKKYYAMNAIKKCTQSLFFLTASPRPVVVEPLTTMFDGDGMGEIDLNKNSNGFMKERQVGPRFAQPGSFDEVYGKKWKQVYEIYQMKKNTIDKELLLDEKQLLEEIDASQYEYETSLMREQVKEREEAIAFNTNMKGRSNQGGNFNSGSYDNYQSGSYGNFSGSSSGNFSGRPSSPGHFSGNSSGNYYGSVQGNDANKAGQKRTGYTNFL